MRTSANGERGSTTVQIVVLFPALLALVFLAFQASWWFYARSLALAAAEEGLHTARAYGANTAAGHGAARDYLRRTAGDALTAPSVDVSSSETVVRVRVTGRSLSLIPGVAGIPVSAEAVGPKERLT